LSSKEGGPHEEEFLVTTMRGMIPTVKFTEEIGALLKILLFLGLREEAKKLQGLLTKFIDLINSSTLDVLTSEEALAKENTTTTPQPKPTKLFEDSGAWKLQFNS
jgi:hypothetical protein